jgi:hypothetical protein
MKGHFAITLFPSRRNASKTPCASLDPYPRPDSSCGTSVEQDDATVFDLGVGDCERAVAEGHFKPAHCRTVPDVAFHLPPPSLERGSGLAQRGQDLRRLLPYREVRLDECAADPAFRVDHVGRGNRQHPDR